MQDSLALRITHDTSEVCGGIVRHSRAQNDRLGILLIEELQHLLQREGAADIGVQNEESVGSTFEDGISEVVETSSRPQCLVLTKVAYSDVRVRPTAIFDKVAEDALIVVADNKDFANLGYFCDGSEAM